MTHCLSPGNYPASPHREVLHLYLFESLFKLRPCRTTAEIGAVCQFMNDCIPPFSNAKSDANPSYLIGSALPLATPSTSRVRCPSVLVSDIFAAPPNGENSNSIRTWLQKHSIRGRARCKTYLRLLGCCTNVLVTELAIAGGMFLFL